MFRRLVICAALAASTLAAQAQIAPSAPEIAAFQGLHKAAQTGDVAEIRRLAAVGVDVDQRDPGGRAAIHIAAFASQDEALKALAEAGADMNALDARRYDVVTIAAVANDPDLMSLAITLGNDAGLTTSPYDGTALIAAADLGHGEIVRRLIAAGAPLDHVNNLGWTALMEAVVLGDGGRDFQEVVKLLVDAGADKAIGDRDGVTPLEHARARGYAEIVSLLEPAS